jgi:hypothetical protein
MTTTITSGSGRCSPGRQRTGTWLVAGRGEPWAGMMSPPWAETMSMCLRVEAVVRSRAIEIKENSCRFRQCAGTESPRFAVTLEKNISVSVSLS